MGDSTCHVNIAYKNCFPTIDPEKLASIHEPFVREDICKVLFDMPAFKSLGPDSIQAGFYQRIWQTVGDSIVNFSGIFLRLGCFLIMLMILCWS